MYVYTHISRCCTHMYIHTPHAENIMYKFWYYYQWQFLFFLILWVDFWLPQFSQLTLAYNKQLLTCSRPIYSVSNYSLAHGLIFSLFSSEIYFIQGQVSALLYKKEYAPPPNLQAQVKIIQINSHYKTATFAISSKLHLKKCQKILTIISANINLTLS